MANKNSNRIVFNSYDYTAIIMLTIMFIAECFVEAYMLRHTNHNEYRIIMSYAVLLTAFSYVVICDLKANMLYRYRYRILHLVSIMILSGLFCIFISIVSELFWSIIGDATFLAYNVYTLITCCYLLPFAIAVAIHPRTLAIIANFAKNQKLQFIIIIVIIIIATMLLYLCLNNIRNYASQSASCYKLPAMPTLDYSNNMLCDTALINEILIVDTSILIVYRIICYMLFVRPKAE